MSNNPVRVSVIVPVYNNPDDLRECLSGLLSWGCPGGEITYEIIVVDDGSTDETRMVARRMGVSVLRLPTNSGPSSARNLGARHARGDILFFVDADVVIRPGAVTRVVQVLDDNPGVAAVFGSYDSQPRAAGLISQYRNLLHHYVHQNGDPDASTFWGACGAIRRSVFEQINCFDEKGFPRCIEDIELGYRLRRSGHRILLDKGLQGTHLKRWTLRSVVRTDVFCRALPWARLILDTNCAPDDLNLRAGQRASTALTLLAVFFLLLAPFWIGALILSLGAILAVIALNRNLYAFFVRRRGPLFTAGAIPLHLLYYLYGGPTYVYARCEVLLKTIRAASAARIAARTIRP